MNSITEGPVTFESPAFENANEVVLHCREVFEKNGLVAGARRLEGLEVTDRNMANVALRVLTDLKACAEEVLEVESARQLAVSNVIDALCS